MAPGEEEQGGGWAGGAGSDAWELEPASGELREAHTQLGPVPSNPAV